MSVFIQKLRDDSHFHSLIREHFRAAEYAKKKIRQFDDNKIKSIYTIISNSVKVYYWGVY
jgi:hypothetical protein